MGNFASASPITKRYTDVLKAKKAAKNAPKQNSSSASTGPAVPAPWVQTTTEGGLSVNRRKRRGKASLLIDITNPTNTGTGGSGLNV